MKNYQPVDVTENAHQIAKMSPSKREVEGVSKTFQIHHRI